MQQVVSKNWYTIFNGFCLFVSLLLIILAISVNSSLHQDLGADSSTALIAGLNVAAIAAVFFFFRNKPFYRIASYLGSIFFILNLIDLIIHTNPGFSFIYFIVWMLVVFYSGAFGEQALVCFGLVTAVFVLVEDNFTFTNSNKDLLVLLIGTFVIGIASYIIFWRSMYTAYRAQNNQRLKNLSKMLNSDEQRSEILIESITDGVIVVDNSGIITLINESAAQMVAWLVNEAIGIDVHLVVKLNTDEGKPIAGTEDPFSIALINKTKVNRTVELVGRNEKTTITSLIVSPVIVPGKTETSTTVGIVAVMRDISAQVAGDKQKADFVSTASHEMRTPIAAIEGYLSLAMNDKVARIDTKAREYLDKAYSSTQHLSELFQDLLTSSKAEDGRISNHPEVVEMGGFIESLVDNLKIAAQNKKMLVDFEFKTTTTVAGVAGKVLRPFFYVHVDPDRIREVITNLFDNAMKYSDKGKITLMIGGNDTTVQFAISDTGVGIPVEDIPHLFQKFYRVDSSAVRTIGGTGLGLFICKKIVELYNGKIWVESQVGVGSTFHIDLPRISTQQAEAIKTKEEEEKEIDMPAANLPL